MADVTNYTIENASGANVRTDLNNVFAAIQSSNSKSSDLASSQCVAGMPFLNTTTNILKIRNSSNGAFTEIGNIDSANLSNPVGAGHSLVGLYIGDGSLFAKKRGLCKYFLFGGSAPKRNSSLIISESLVAFVFSISSFFIIDAFNGKDDRTLSVFVPVIITSSSLFLVESFSKIVN